MDKTRVERHVDVVNSIIKLEEIILENTIEDEIVGDTVMMDAWKLMEHIKSIREKITVGFSVELSKPSIHYKPLRDAVKVMNNGRGRKRNTDESETEDDLRKAPLGKIPQQAPFGGIKVSEDRDRDS